MALEKWLTDTQPTSDPAQPSTPIDAPDDSDVMRWFSGAQDTAQLKTSIQAGVATPPDNAARTLKLQAKTGLPVDLISRNLDTIEADTARADFDAEKYRKDNPVVAGWLAQHPDHAAVAQDDYDSLSTIEKTVNALSRGVAALSQQGSAMKLAGDARMLERYSELERRAAAGEDLSQISPQDDPYSLRFRVGRSTGVELKQRLTESVQTSVKNIVEKQAKIKNIPQDANIANALAAESFSDFWYWFSRNPTGFIGLVGAESLPQAVPAMGLAVAGGLTAGPPGAIAGLGAGSFATDYAASTIQALQEEGVDFQDPQALQRAFADKELMNRVGSRAFRHAAPVAAFDALSGGVAGKMLTPAIKKPLLREGANAVVQAPIQGALGAAGEATGQLASGGELHAGQIMAEFFGEFAQTPVEIASVAGGRVVQSLREALRAKERQQFFAALGEGVTNSKTFARLPEGLKEIVARATKDGPLENLYIPVESWNTYFQTAGIDPRNAAQEMLGSVTAYEEALRTGTDMPIPTATYATKIAPTEYNAALSQDLRINPYDMNGREAEAWFADYTKSEPEAVQTDGATKVRDDVTGQLVGTGFDQHTAETYAGLYESTFRALGERTGRDPFELYSKYKLSIGRELPDVLRSIGKMDNLDVLLNRMRTGDMPKSKDVFGPSLLEFLRPIGLQDQGGELSARDLHKRRKFFERSLVRDDGVTLDDAAERAVQAGYIGERDPNLLLEAIDEELSGRARYAAGRGDPALKETQAAADQLSDYLNQVGIDITQVDNQTLKRLLMQESGPTASTSAELYQAARVRIQDVVEQAAQPGNIQAKATIAPAPTWLVDAAAAAGMNIDGYKHVIDTSAVRHVLNQHGSVEAETARGNVAVTAADFEAIPEIVGAPDKVIFGTKNKGGRQQVIYLKSMPDGSTLYFEETRTGRKDLAAVTLRKYPAAMNADSILSTLDLDVQGDGGDGLIIVDRPAVAKGPATDTPEFKRWFGASKVVDESSKPLRVYHGTTKSFSKFDGRKSDVGIFGDGFYFTDRPDAAEEYAEGDGGNIMPVYLAIENPMPDSELRSLLDEVDAGNVDESEIRDEIQSRGYDGVIARMPTGDETVYAALYPEQIKSTIGNRGTFDPTDPSILNQAGDTKKGFIRIGSASMSIRLLEKADLSTFLHESGHFYLEVLGDLAQDQNAPAKLRADYQTILDWFGVTSREEITVEHHEQWARGFEAYLMEGKSPSTTLAAAFARFRAWLIGVYRSLTNLDVTLTPGVRAVMDRLVATDEEIENALKLSSLQPLFTDAAQAGMSAAEFAKYRADADEARAAAESDLATKAMREYRRESERWWKEARAEVYKEVAAEVDQQQVYIALAALSRGTHPDGSPLPDGVQPVKLSRKGILDSFGADMLKRLPRPHVYAKEGGLHPDIAADLFGYHSGEELLLALANVRPRKQLIEAETDVRMRERYGDMRLDGTIATDAMNAVHNEQRALLLRKELQHLATHHLPTLKKLVRKISHRVPTIEAVRTMAERAIASKRVRDISPALYERASAKASRNAVNAMLRGDFETAFAEKQKQLLNHELQRAAAAAREKVDGIVEHMGKFGKRSTREKLGRAGGDYLDQIDAILERFDFRKGVSIKAIERRKALAAWVTEQNETGFTVDMPARLLNEAYRQHYKDTSYEELVGIDDAVRTIEHLAGLKNKLLANQRTQNLEDARADIVGSIGANHSLAPAPLDFAPGFKARTKEGAKGFAAAHSKPEFIFEWLDGNKPLGAVWQHLFKPFVDADATENKMMRNVSAGLAKIFQAYPRKERATWFFHRTFIPEINTSLTKANMLAVGLNWGNQYNRDALMRGYGWSETQVKAVLDRLDARDWQTVQGIWDYIDSFWPQIEAREKELSGIAPGKVEAAEVVTAHGTFRGGYYPIVFDSKLSWRQAVLEEKAHARDLFGGNWARAMTRHGHTVERTDTGGKPIRLELSGLTEHITNVVHDLAYRPALIDVGRLLNDKEIREAIEHSIGREYYRQLNPWLASMASDRRDYSNPIEGMLGRARAGATIVNMGWKLTTALTQILGFATSAKEIGIKYTALGIADSYGTPGKISEAWEFMTSRSEQMNSRLRTFDRDVRDSFKRLNVAGVKPGVGSMVDAYTGQIRDSFFILIGYMDMAVSMPTWMGAYRKAMDGAVDNVTAGDEPAAIDYADQMIRETQGSGAAKDLALVQRGAESFRLFTMFYSYFSVLFNQFAKTTRQFRIDRNAPKLFASMALLWFIPAVLQDLMLGRGPDEDADEEEWTRWLLAREAAYPFQSMILVRDVINGMDQYGYEPSAAFDMYESLARTGSLGLKLAGGDKEEIERKDVKGLVMTAGYTLHLPTRQMWLTGEYFYDWLGGEVNPEHPAEAAWQGLVTGKPK